ncbi:DNA-processing protein DprA [Pseudooctadecabacter sp.]|uniref:DNA-processing protein DprA n=1 Tax=Pseudooctadecabacter sp. TaxID=1966338 RepID=UPI0025FBB619|nr:DNA-processing protein DprA [Pseudooctadecabacter sp.]
MTLDETSSTHPPLPPTTEDDRVAHLRLLRSRRVGPATYRRLLNEHKTAHAALDALPQIAADAGIAGYRACPEGVAHAELKAGRLARARLVFAGEAGFPKSLYDIDDAPVALWMTGRADLLNTPMVALIGARNASSLGTRMASKLAAELGEAGFTIVSGLARGVDAAAHIKSLSTGTIAVVAGGVDVLYPAENAELARQIARDGLCLSDQPMGFQPRARHFVARNRIISGLVRAVVVVEAAAKSGSLGTARTALDQGRDVLAVPGHPFDARVAGCNMLIRDGATLIRGTQDIIEHLGNPKPSEPELPLDVPPAAPPRPLRDIAALHDAILDRLLPGPLAEDQLIRALGASANTVAPALVDLELDGKVIRQSGGILARTI